MQIALYVADDIRALADGKMLAVGLYGDRTVVLQAPAEAIAQMLEVPLAFKLSLLLTISDVANGTHSFTLSMQTPDAPLRSLGPTVQRNVADGAGTNLVVNIDPLTVRSAGTFVVHCQVDEEPPLLAEFEVRTRVVPAPAPAPAASK